MVKRTGPQDKQRHGSSGEDLAGDAAHQPPGGPRPTVCSQSDQGVRSALCLCDDLGCHVPFFYGVRHVNANIGKGFTDFGEVHLGAFP